MRASRAFAAVVVLLAFGIGCAYQDATVRPPASASVAAGGRIWGSPSVVLAMPFVDERPDRSRCGMKKAGGKKAANVYCSDAPAQWLAALVAGELRAAGFRVYDKEAPPGEAAVRIEGFLSQLFVEPDVEVEYDVFYSQGRYIPESDIAVRLVARGANFEAERHLKPVSA
jgi:hypothetical protein